MTDHPFVVTISSEKGGVGKTTLATNLAIFLKALDENLPVSILSFDNHFTVDKMFQIKGQPLQGDVADLLRGAPGLDLLHTGQYGVNYIPSSRVLAELKHELKGSLMLARILATSAIPGIVIIDTRPELDILTQNALFAADRAIIPVKDMASLENCRNIFDLFDRKGFERKSLSLVPCIIDSRIKFDGPFKDQRALLKAYAINRGYRCLDIFISKSPKVESLATNPAGKVLPILTHARNTDVFAQFTQLAKSVLEDFAATPSSRARLFHEWLLREEERSAAALAARRRNLRGECLLCRQPYDGTGRFAYYFESSNGAASGFLEEPCFSDLLLSSIFEVDARTASDDPRRLMVHEAGRDSTFVFRPTAAPMLELSRFDRSGRRVMKKELVYTGTGGNGPGDNSAGLSAVMAELSAHVEAGREFLIVHPVDAGKPEEILREENYRIFTRLKQSISQQISGAAAV